MNYKDTFINFEAMQKGMEDTLNPPPDISSIIWKNLKNGLSERGIEPKDIEGMNKNEAKKFIKEKIYQDGIKQSVVEGKVEESELNETLGIPTPISTHSTNIESFTNIPLKQKFSFTKLKRNIENFGDIYDRRVNEYDNCKDVGEVIKKIRKGDDPSWKSSSIVKQVNCEPVYDWDGKFYKDKASAEAGSTSEEIMSPSDSGTLTTATDKKEPGAHVRKLGKFTMSSFWADHWASEIALNSNGKGWLSKGDRYMRKSNWLQMETVSGNIEMIKGVVTKGSHNHAKNYVKKFKVFVSRNGDSWKQVKNSSNQEEFTGHSDSNYKKETKNYFNEVVEAKYIRVYPTDYNRYPALRLGYIKDKSGTINCTGGSGFLKTVVNDDPYFRFTFNEAKTKTHGIMSEGTSNSTKDCPSNGEVMIAKKTPFSISLNTDFAEDKIKLVDGNQVKGIKEVMKNKVITGCGSDPSSPGWYSSSSGGSQKTWSACKIPNNTGLLGTANPYHTDHGGFRYMYRHWSGSNNNGYNKWINNYTSYLDNTHSPNANNGSTYTLPSTNIKVSNYNSVNVIRQPCNRGPKGVVPIPGDTVWESTTPYVDGITTNEASGGYMGKIRNLTGGKEGWIDTLTKYTWSNDFNNQIKEYTEGDTVLNDYGINEHVGTNAWVDNTTTWSSDWRGEKGIGASSGNWHSPKGDSWSDSLTRDNWTSRYEDTGKFIPIGIRIQPYDGTAWERLMPTVIRFRCNDGTHWHWGDRIVLGKFTGRNVIKTILINPEFRKKFIDNGGNGKCTKWWIYTRHGYNRYRTSYRVNFLLGQKGTGKKSVEKYWTASSPHKPVDCSTSLSGERSSEDDPGWTAKSNCWVGGNGCGDWESTSQSWEQRTVTITKWKDRTVNSPNYGGKNNCTGGEEGKTTSTRPEEQKVRSCGSEHCAGSSCSHCPGRPTCYRGSTATWKCNPGGSTGWTWDRIFGS